MRSQLERVMGQSSSVAGGTRVDIGPLEEAFLEMLQEAERLSDSNDAQAQRAIVQKYGPRIARIAASAQLISRDKLRDMMQRASWPSSLQEIRTAMDAQGSDSQTVTRYERGDVAFYVVRNASRGIEYVHMQPREQSFQPQSPLRGRTLTDLLIEYDAGERDTAPLVRRVRAMLAFLKTDIPTRHAALNTGNIRIGDSFVIVVGWNDDDRSELGFYGSFSSDNAVSRFVREIQTSGRREDDVEA